MRRGKGRQNLAPPIQVVSGRVILLSDFVVTAQGPGMLMDEIEAADLPVEAMYFARHTSGLVIYALPIVRTKMANYQLSHSADPGWKFDPSYRWAEKVKEDA
jgi:hypothetical protein